MRFEVIIVITEEMIRVIVDRVLSRLEEKEHQGLVLFTGGALGFNDSLDQLVKLQESGWSFTAVMSKGAENMMKEDLIKEKLSLEKVYLESQNEGLHSLYQDSSILIIPTLTMNTAAKISLGIADNLATNLASRFIMEGLPIFAATDACNPEHPYRIARGKATAPQSYVNMFHSYLSRLKDFGLELVQAKDLQQAVVQYNQKPFRELPEGEALQLKRGKKKVITRAEVMKAKENGSMLEVSADSIITALAEETAAIEGVKLVRSGD